VTPGKFADQLVGARLFREDREAREARAAEQRAEAAQRARAAKKPKEEPHVTTIRDLLQRRPDGRPIPGTAPPPPPSNAPAISNGPDVVDVLRHALGVTVVLPMLSADDQLELAELVAKSQEAADPATIINLGTLSAKERTRVERLCEKSIGEPGLFVRLRRERADAAKLAALSARANRPTPVTSALSGDVLEQLAGGFLTIDHLAVLSLVSVVLDAAEIPPAWANGMHFEAGALVLTYIPVQIDERQTNLGTILAHLQANSWLMVEGRAQPPWTISPGPRLRNARRDAKPAA
jgi:hypothetical protein